MMKRNAIGLLLFGLALTVDAANITPFINANGGLNLDISGDIMDGDEVALREIIQVAKSNTVGIDFISLNSTGGDEDVALSLAYSIFSIQANTIVTDRSTCSNECFLLFSAGNNRVILPKAKVGLKKPTQDGKSNGVLTVYDIFDFYHLPKEITYHIKSINTNKLHWLTKKEKRLFDSKAGEINYDQLTGFKPVRYSKKNTGFTNYLNGLSYYFGLGVEQDYRSAFEYFTLAAEDNVPQALHKLGVMFYNGRYAPKDHETAEMLWNKSAAMGYYPSLNNIALAFEKVDAKESIEINRKILSSSADADTKGYAAVTLANYYKDGVGVTPSKTLAFDYYKQAAYYGNSAGQYQYATLLSEDGDRQQANLWFNTACSVGETNSCRVLRK